MNAFNLVVAVVAAVARADQRAYCIHYAGKFQSSVTPGTGAQRN